MGKNHLRLVALGLAVSCCGFLMAQQAGKKTEHAQKSTGEAAAVSIPLAKAPAEMAPPARCQARENNTKI